VVASCGSRWALRAGIGMTIILPGHPMSVTQCHLAMNDTYFIRVVYSFASFPSDWMRWLWWSPIVHVRLFWSAVLC